MPNLDTTPFYEIEVKTSGCALELEVNDVTSLLHARPGGMAVDWPINEYILQSGEQSFSIKALPYSGQQLIDERATIELTVYVREAIADSTPREKVLEVPPISFEGKQTPTFEKKITFEAEVPYTLDGWYGAVPLVKEDKDALLEELAGWYDRFAKIYRSQDLAEYNRITKERFEELATAFYLTDEQIQRRKQSQLSSTFSDVKKIPLQNYRLDFSGQGRMVGIKRPRQPCGFAFKSQDPDNDKIITELALFKREKKERPLTLIR